MLLSSEAGQIYCWSLYGERKDMGMFYAPSKAGESVLAMSTDTTNRYLITGDTSGEVRLWNIEHYCCSLVSPVPFESSPPILVHSWQAHLSPITFCEWTDYKGNGDFLLTAATDHTARLWTLTGEEIGIFGQRQPWDIDVLLTARSLNDEQPKREASARPVETDHNGSDRSFSLMKHSSFLLVRLEVASVQTEKTIPVSLPEINLDRKDEPTTDKRPLSKSTTLISEVLDSRSLSFTFECLQRTPPPKSASTTNGSAVGQVGDEFHHR